MQNKQQLTEEDKNNYIRTFFRSFEIFLEKKRFNKKARTTKVSSKYVISTWPYGLKKEYTLTNKRKTIKFSIEVRPWLWDDGTVWVNINFVDAKKLALPKKLIKPREQGAIWKFAFDPISFLHNTDSVANYIASLEMTIMDVSLFDSVKAAAANFLT